jgi:hypothetical protein
MNDQQIHDLFNPLYARFDNMDRLTKAPPLLAHYTSIELMEKSLQHNRMWFSNPLFMNDLQEMRFGLVHSSHSLDIILASAESNQS